MASVMSNPLINTGRRHKKKSLHQIQGGVTTQTMINNNNTRWRTATEQHNYSSKLLQALRHVRITTPSSATRRGRAIRHTADRVLAMTAKGRTRWSRAMLTNRLKLKFLKTKKPKLFVSLSRTRRKPRVNVVCLRAVQKKALVLGNLVPGCRKQPLPVILEEAHDYISALEMQVRAMTALAELLSVAGAVSSTLSSPPRPAAP